MAQRVSLSDPDLAIRCLETDGGVIITDFSTVSDVSQVNADAHPFLDEIAKERAVNNQERGTLRCYRLFGRSETAREKWLQQPNFLKIVRHFLSTHSSPYGDLKGEIISTDPILSVAATMEISPGTEAQTMHRDDFIWQQTHDRRPGDVYRANDEVSMGLIVPGVETTKENGATMFVRGSHQWQHSKIAEPEEVSYAEMTVGEAFIFLGSTVHGGGHNATSEPRTVHGFFYCRSYLRPEENQFLWWKREEVEGWSDAAKKQAGYVMDNPYLGHCNESNPLDRFRVG